MKRTHEATIQFSGYPLKLVETKPPIKKLEFIVPASSVNVQIHSSKTSLANDPGNWDVEWFNSYE